MSNNMKGTYDKECNRTACNNSRAVFYNKSTQMYDCAPCAKLINDANRNDSLRLYGTPFLCELVEKKDD